MLRTLLPACLVIVCIASVDAEDRPIAASANEVVPLKAGDSLPDKKRLDVETILAELKNAR